MFKGLKSKLEDEAKKLQATVQSTVAQYGESISQQVGQIRTAASDAGSDSNASVSRRFFGANTSQNDPDASSSSLNYSVGNALMEEVAEGDLLGLDLPPRERRHSGGSNHSNESSLSNLFSSVPGMAATTLDTVDSDVESTVDDHGSAVVRSASKEQISSVLHKLQGRAANYKDKYRDLVKRYNEVVTENNKCRTVLAQTQDKALHRIEKLRNEKKILSEKLVQLNEGELNAESEKKLQKYEDMLKKCTHEIKQNRAKLTEMSEENERLKHNVNNVADEAGVSDLASERVVSEWKSRVQKMEEDWSERLNKAESDAAITLAQSKADMHVALENKDKEVESLRSKCRTLEIQDGQANERWQKKVDELKLIVSSLETEKSDMVEKLSEAKVQGVKAVREEEERKREEMREEFSAKEMELSKQLEELKANLIVTEERLRSSENEKEEDSELKNRIVELESAFSSARDKCLQEEQKYLEIEKKHAEEVEDMKSTISKLQQQLRSEEETENTKKDVDGELEAEIRHLQEKIHDVEQSKLKEVSHLQEVIEIMTSKQKNETDLLIKEHEDILNSVREQSDIERRHLQGRYENVHSCAESLRANCEVLEGKLEELQKERDVREADEGNQRSTLMHELEEIRRRLVDAEKKCDECESELVSLRSKHEQLQWEHTVLGEELERTRDEESEKTNSASYANSELSAEVDELKKMLDERNATVRHLEEDHQRLEIELAEAKELSAIHGHLREQLEEARKQRDNVESKVLELEKRAEKAEKQLQEDRQRLAEDKALVECDMGMADKEKGIEEEILTTSSFSGLHTSELQTTVSVHNDTTGGDGWDGLMEDMPTTENAGNTSNADLLLDLDVGEGSGAVSPVPPMVTPLVTIPPSDDHTKKEEEMNELMNKLEKIEIECDGLREKLTVCESQLQTMYVEGEEKEKEREKLKEELEECKSSLSTGQEKQKEREEKMVEYERRMEELIEEGETKTRQLTEQTEKLDAALTVIETSNKSLMELEESREELEKLREERAEEHKVAETQRKEMEEELARVRETLTELQTHVSSTEMSSGAESERLRGEVERLEKERKEWEEKSEQMAKEKDILNAQLEDVSSKRTLLEEQLEVVTKEKETVGSQLNQLQQRLDEQQIEMEEIKKKTIESEEERKRLSTVTDEVLLVKTQLEESEKQLEKSKGDVRRLEEELEKQRDGQASDLNQKVLHLEEVAEKMRKEFLEKEKVVSELRSEIESARKETKEARDERAEADILIQGLKDNLTQSLSDMSSKEEQIKELGEKIEEMERNVEELDRKRGAEKTDEEKIREQYATAMETTKSELEIVRERVKEMEGAESERQRLRREMDALAEEYARYREEQTKEQETAISDMKRKAENKLGKIKKEMEKDVGAAKAELLLQIDELRASISVKEQLIDEAKIERAKIEQQLIGEQQLRDELGVEKEKTQQSSSRLKELERRVTDLSAECESMTRECTQLRECRQKAEEEKEELKEKILNLESEKEEGFKKAVVKQDVEGKKVVRELQREVKQLYVELTEKTQLLDKERQRVKELEEAKSSVENGCEVRTVRVESAEKTDDNYMTHEEIDSLRKRLTDAHREIDELREEKVKKGGNSRSPSRIRPNNNADDHSFAEPTEAEYLRNVLYRYMNERETLGKEVVTLARVIGTVCRFSKPQIESVITKEESRIAGWGVQQALQGTVLPKH